MKIIFILTLSLAALSAQAYIPSTNFVIGKLVASHGKGSYIVDQEVTLKDRTNPGILIRERIFVVDGGEALFTAKGSDGFNLWRLMKRGRIHWAEGSSEKADIPSTDNPHQILFGRTAADYKQKLLKLNILVPQNLNERRIPKDPKDANIEPEPNVRLGRVGGTVTITYGKPAPITAGPLPPGLWLEQDLFVVRKFRASPDAEFVGDDPTEYSKGFVYPRQQTITFGDGKTALIRVTRVQAAEFSPEIKKQFEPTYLRGRPELSTAWPASASAGLVSEFYQRFR